MLEGVQINSTLNKQQIFGGTSGIYSRLCFFDGAVNATTLQSHIHGLGIDRSYWNDMPNYSYVDYAVEQGYTTFLV